MLETKTKPHSWSKAEEDILRYRYDGCYKTVQLLAHEIGVTSESIRNKARKLGLTRRRYSYIRWTEKEDNQLEELLGQVSISQIAKIMGCSSSRILNRIRIKGLNRRVRFGWFTEKEVVEALGVSRKRIARYIKEGVLKASRHNGNSDKDYWHISQSDFKDFIVKYCLEFTSRNVDLFTIVHLFDE